MVGPRTGRIVIRSARHEDVDGVLALWERARSPAASTPDTAESVTRLIEHAPDALLVADRDGELVGAVIASWDGWRGNMYRAAVLPSYRGRGIARRLVEVGHERLRAKGARRVTALVADAEEDATALWRATGYRHDEQLSRFVRDL